MTEPPPAPAKTLELKQTWFLGVAALAVVSMFVFVILPYVDPKKAGQAVAGQVAQDFDLELIGGGAPGDRVRLSDLRGKPVILDFWASWCQPCREQGLALVQAAAQLGDDVTILGIATGDQRKDALDYLATAQLPYSNGLDAEGEVGRAYQVAELPTLMILDANGQIRGRYSRVVDASQVIELVRALEVK